MESENEQKEQLLTREQLAARWQCSTKTVDRLRALPKNHPKRLKSTELTQGTIRFRLKDIKEFERRSTKHFLSSLSNFSDDDQAAEWIELARLAGLDKQE